MSNNNQDRGRGLHIDIDHLSIQGHGVFAGRDGSVTINTGGNVDQQSTQVITVGGVETTPEALQNMKAKIEALYKVIENESLDDETAEAALHDLKTVEEQLTKEKKPNGKILSAAGKALYRLSPALASAVFALFGEPLASQIVVGVGGIALQFLEAMTKRRSGK